MLRSQSHPTFLWKSDEPPAGDPPKDPANPAGTGTPPADPPADPPKDPADDPVAKAYAKLREAEAARDALQKENRQLKTKDLPEAERAKAERDQLNSENEALKQQLAETTVKGTIEAVARTQGYRSPAAAMGLLRELGGVDPLTLDTEDKVAKALRDLASGENAYLVETPPPSGGPVNPAGGREASGTAGFNQAIRQAAGRG